MKSSFGLYIHIPFCQSRCHYCDFLSLTARRDDPRFPAYTTALLRALEEQAPRYAPFSTIYIGGGTPSLLPLDSWQILLEALATYRMPGQEWTVEANPESLTADHLELFDRYGVNRLSIGIQSFQDPILENVGRITRLRDLERTRNFLRNWRGSLNVDLICGLPGQTETGQKEDLRRALEWPCDHVSWYSLTVEEDTPLYTRCQKKEINLPSEDETERWWLEGRDYLVHRGYAHYEISNFAQPGKESRHNLGYWRLEPYLGLGCGAVSTLPGSPYPYRLTCPDNPEQFARETFAQREVITPAELEKDMLMMGLRTSEGIHLNRWQNRWKTPWGVRIPRTLHHWKNSLDPDSDRLALTDEGRLLLDIFLRDAFEELESMPPPELISWPD